MDDGIIKGTGNSRFLKSIPDFLSQYPTYQDFVAALAAGTLPVDFNGINETGWQQLGTALNKGNLLSDETAAMYGLGTDAVPDSVFKTSKNLIDNAQNSANSASSLASEKANIQYGSRTPNGADSYTINFSFRPRCVLMKQYDNVAILVYGSVPFRESAYTSVSWSGTSVTISTIGYYSESLIFNEKGKDQCYYVAFG